MKKRKKNVFTKKIKKFSSGHKMHKDFINIITVMNSNNDEYDSLFDYLFYKVLNMTPTQYFNASMEYYHEKDLEDAEKMYNNYCNKVKISEELEKQINEIIAFVRTEAKNDNKVKTIGGMYIPTEFFTMFYLQKKILKFYNNIKRMEE